MGSAIRRLLLGVMAVVSCNGLLALQYELTLDEVLAKSDGVFVGAVKTQSCRMAPNGKMIFTDVRFTVEEWVGSRVDPTVPAGGELVLSFAGGRVGDKACVLSDVPVLKTGNIYLICALLDGKPHSSPVAGAFQGLFKVHKDASSGRRYVTNHADQAVLDMDARGIKWGPRVDSVAGGLGRMNKRPDPPTGLFTVPPVAADGNPAHQAKASPVAIAAAEARNPAPAALMPLDRFVPGIRERFRKIHAAKPAQ